MRSASRSVSAPSQQTRTPPCWRFQFVPPAKFQERIRAAKSKQAELAAPREARTRMGAAFDFLRRERVLAVEKSFSFEFQMKKDGEPSERRTRRARRRELAPLRVAHPSTSVSGLDADNVNRVVERSHAFPGARVRSFVASVRDHRGCQPRNSSGLPWRVLQSVSEARLRPRACVKDGR